MNWLILVAFAVVFDSLRIFTDNYSSDVYFKGRLAVSQKIYHGISHVIIYGILLAITGFNVLNVEFLPLILLIISGVFASLSGIPYFRALELDDSTNIGIFTQLSPVFYLILGWFFLGDTFSPMQLVAFAIILSAPFLIVFTARKRSRKIKIRAVIYAFFYVLIAVIGNLLFVKAHDSTTINFVQEIGVIYLSSGVVDLILSCSIKKWRRRFFAVSKKSKGKVYVPLIANTFFGLVKQFAYRGALVVAPAVALASVASDSAEPIVIFFLGLLLTLIWPKFGREKLTRKTVLVHLIATALVVIGVVLLQF